MSAVAAGELKDSKGDIGQGINIVCCTVLAFKRVTSHWKVKACVQTVCASVMGAMTEEYTEYMGDNRQWRKYNGAFFQEKAGKYFPEKSPIDSISILLAPSLN